MHTCLKTVAREVPLEQIVKNLAFRLLLSTATQCRAQLPLVSRLRAGSVNWESRNVEGDLLWYLL